MTSLLRYPAGKVFSLGSTLACLCLFAGRLWKRTSATGFQSISHDRLGRHRLSSGFDGSIDVMRTECEQQPRFHRQRGRIGRSVAKYVYPFRCRTPVIARATGRYGEWDASATGHGELQPRITNHRCCAVAFAWAGDSIRTNMMKTLNRCLKQ